MSELSPILFLTMLSLIMGSTKDVKNTLHGGRIKGILLKTEDETGLAITAIKNLHITSPRDKVELINMANEFTHKMESASYTLTQAVPNIKNEDDKTKALGLNLQLENIIHGIKVSYLRDTDKLQENLVSFLNDFAQILGKGIQVLNEDHGATDILIGNQLRKATDIAIFAIYRLKYQALFFNKTNKELGSEIEAGIILFIEVMNTIVVDDEETKKELVHLYQHLEKLADIAIFKLENWIQINTKHGEPLRIVQDAAEALSNHYNTLHITSGSQGNATYFSTELKKIYQHGAGKIRKMANIEVHESLGDQEFIRSVLLDSLVVSHTSKAQIEIFLNTKNMHNFV